MDSKFTRITWTQLEKDTLALAKKIRGTKIDEIISISRGGMVPSRIISDVLKLPISHIAIESYSAMKQEKEPVVTQVSPRKFKGETILLVDEVSDTGKTFERALFYLATLPINKVYTASPYIKPHTKFIPDFWVKNLDTWILFPYELRDNFDALTQKFESTKKAKNKMLQLGFKPWEIELD